MQGESIVRREYSYSMLDRSRKFITAQAPRKALRADYVDGQVLLTKNNALQWLENPFRIPVASLSKEGNLRADFQIQSTLREVLL
jgi:hypothetical protein